VWLESVPENYVEKLIITPDFDGRRVRIEIRAKDPEGAEAVICKDGFRVAGERYSAEKGYVELAVAEEHFRPWTPEDQFLYDVTVTLKGGDAVQSYFGMRKFGVTAVNGKKVLALNDRPIFMSGVLDQGYWSDGLYTPPSDEAMVYDIRKMKECGFNMLRKHIKIEPLRWYYHCDRLGMIVWQDLVSGGSRRIACVPAVNTKRPFSMHWETSAARASASTIMPSIKPLPRTPCTLSEPIAKIPFFRYSPFFTTSARKSG